MRVGVVGVQGAVSEHVEAARRAIAEGGFPGDAVAIRHVEDLAKADALVIPGGESTTISKLLVKFGLFDDIVRRAHEGMPVLGTCAGCILLAKEGDNQVTKTETRLLGLMDMAVDRNAFGRQRESFEADVEVSVLDRPFRGVFIRAPEITRTWGSCTPIGKVGGKIVLARQDALVGSALCSWNSFIARSPPHCSFLTRTVLNSFFFSRAMISSSSDLLYLHLLHT